MSAKYMGMVYECQLPFNKAWVLMAMADHADHEGNNVFPALPLVAWKTGYSLDSIKRIVRELRDDEILVPYAATAGGVKIYRIQLDHVLRKPEYVKLGQGRPKGIAIYGPRGSNSESQKKGCHINTPFENTHNRHRSLNSNSSSLTSLNSKSNYGLLIDDFDCDEDIYGDEIE